MNAPARINAWTRISLECGDDAAPALEEALGAAGAIAVSVEEGAEANGRATAPRFAIHAGGAPPPLWDRVRVSGLFAPEEDGLARLAPHVPPETLARARVSQIEDRDWVRAGQERIGAMQFGERLWVRPSWAELPPDATRSDTGPLVIELDPGLAFGTGSHPTTRLCLEQLTQMEVGGKFVIDYGCGSGILGIAALKLSARHCLAVDIDEDALGAACANAERNQVAERFEAVTPDSAPPAPPRADILVANILADPLIALRDTFAELIHPDGTLLLAGVLAEQVERVKSTYAPHFQLEVPACESNWALLRGAPIC